jgi:hypothetical protein
MYIRAHHLWILQGIIEHRGSVSQIPLFREKWKKIYEEFISPNSEVIPISSVDDICSGCPDYRVKENCPDYPPGDNCDDIAIQEFGLSYNVKYSGKEIFDKLKSRKIYGTNLVRA